MKRVAVVSDIHGNLTALDAVIADLRRAGADLVVHGGDLVHGCPRPAEVIDRIRELNWPGVCGNTDEMLWKPDEMSERLAARQLHRICDLLIEHSNPATVRSIGPERLAWLRTLPARWTQDDVAVVHAAPDDPWTIVPAHAPDEEMERVFGGLAAKYVVYGHIHQPFVRRLRGFTLINAGAVSLSFDGDWRAAYALLDGDRVEIRRVEYDVEREVALLQRSADPFAGSFIDTLRTGRYAPLREAEPGSGT